MAENKPLHWILTHESGRKEGVVGQLPTLPARLALLEAWRAAEGLEFVEVTDEDGTTRQVLEAVRDADAEDLAAVAWAALGLCWAPGQLDVLRDVPSFRAFRRDVVAYGEAVGTALFDVGYRDQGEAFRAGRACLDAVQTATLGHLASAVEVEAEGFATAQEQR